MRISMIVAMGRSGVIGAEGRLPWRLPADLRNFKAKTMGHHILMGRRTHESIGRPLPGRVNVVISRNPGYRSEGCTVVGSLDAALAVAREAGDDEAFIVGGGEIYGLGLGVADRIYLTRVLEEFEGDTHFPALEEGAWTEVSRQAHAADERNPHDFELVVLDRVRVL